VHPAALAVLAVRDQGLVIALEAGIAVVLEPPCVLVEFLATQQSGFGP
jgi:hypothetical protein